MHNEIEFSFVNVLLVMLGLAMGWWMCRAPRSFLKLMSTRFPGLDKDRPWLNSVVRGWGRLTFFGLVSALLMMITPNSATSMTGVQALQMLLAIGISVFALRKPKADDAYSAALKNMPPAGGASKSM